MMYLYAFVIVSLATIAGNIGSHLLMLWHSRREWRQLETKAQHEAKQMFADIQAQVEQQRKTRVN